MASRLLWMATSVVAACLVGAGAALTLAGAGVLPPQVQAAATAVSGQDAIPLTDAAAAVLTEKGDEIQFHVAFFDGQSRMLLSTRASDRAEMERVKAEFPGFYALPTTEEDAAQRHVIEDGLRPIPLGTTATVPLGQTFLGKPVGFVTAIPVVGKMAGYDNTTVLERTRGPFNLTMLLSTEKLDTFTDGEDVDRFSLDDLFSAQVLERGELVSRIRIDVAEGQVLTVRNAGFRATVHVDEAADQFYLHLDTDVGHEFALNQGCQFARYVLPLGSYRVTAMDDETITLESSPTRWPQMIGQDMVMIMEIVEINKQEASAE